MVKKSKSKDKLKVTNAVSLLQSEHEEVASLFDEFESAEDEEQEDLAAQICQKLTVHAQIEEEILYPAAKDVLEEDDVDLVNEAAVEHQTAKDLIAKIEAMDSSDEYYKATVKVLSEYIKHHVEEEETELFPLLQDSKLDLDDMGLQLASRKAELLAELGDEDEDDDDDSDEDDADQDGDDAEVDDEEDEEDEAVLTKPTKSKPMRNGA